MGEKKVTTMVLKVDLQCSKCYKKVKKVLCKFPQIQDQIFDEKTNTVRIKVVCCNPEKIRDKLCCKGEGSIKSIAILEPPPPKPKETPKEPQKPKETPKEPEKPKETPKAPEKPKETPKAPEKPKETPKEPEKPKETPKAPEKPKETPKEPEKPKETPKAPEKPKETPKEPPKPSPPAPAPAPAPVPCHPPVGVCCRECYEGRGGGPCYYLGYGPTRHYDGYCGRPVYESWAGGCDTRGYYRSRCSDYICEENPTAPCTIM